MFAIYCPELSSRVIVFMSQVQGITNHDKGIDVSFRCPCGAVGVWRSGIRAAREELVRHDTAQAQPDEPWGHSAATPRPFDWLDTVQT